LFKKKVWNEAWDEANKTETKKDHHLQYGIKTGVFE
jgi:hypothetical protein